MFLSNLLQVAKVHGYDAIWLGYERSADEGNNVYWHGQEVNHQYDKSSTFLHSVRRYLRCFESTTEEDAAEEGREGMGGGCVGITIASPLHDMWELEVCARMHICACIVHATVYYI